METKKFVLLDIDYITRKGEAVIRLFGKLTDNEERVVIAMDNSFKPYMYVVPHDVDLCIDELSKFNLLNIEKTCKNDVGVSKKLLKITLKHPNDIPKLKEKIFNIESVKQIREHDIPFYRRYLIDNGLFPMNMVEVQGKIMNSRSSGKLPCIFKIEKQPQLLDSDLPELSILSFDIETCNPGGVPEHEDPINMISFSSNHGLRKVVSTKDPSLDFVEFVPDEKDLIQKFVETIRAENPDIILGYNSEGFDFPYIKARAEKVGVPLKLGVDGSTLKFTRKGRKNAAMIKGRIHIDLYSVVRRNIQLDRHTLERVYRELFGEDKIDIPVDDIYTCWKDNGEKLEKLFKYSLEDAAAINKIGEKLLPLSIELTRIIGQPLFDVVRMGSGKQVESYLIRKAFEYGDLSPNKFGRYLRDVVGGHVEEPTKGLHTDIHYFDFRSLYPSIIISKNISPDTHVTEDGEECHITPEFGYKFRKTPVGFIPSVISEILENRIMIKSKMEESTDIRERQMLNYQQEALKRLASTVYGLFNHSTFRWYSIECSEAITAWGRDFLKKTMKKAELYGFKPIYADTDGFYAVYTGPEIKKS